MKQEVTRRIISEDTRKERIILGAGGILERQTCKNQDNIGTIDFIKKNNLYYLPIEGLDCRRKKLEVIGNVDFSIIYRLCFLN